MKTRIIGYLAIAILSLNVGGCATNDISTAKKTTVAKPTVKVAKLIKKFNLDVVDFNHVNKAVGGGSTKGVKSILVDARPKKKYLVSTIPTSVNITVGAFEEEVKQLDKISKAKEIITFCGGWHCGLSAKVASMLKKKGFTNVKLYQAGQPDWNKQSYLQVSTAVVRSAYFKNNTLIIDSRPYKKYLQETIPGAMPMPVDQFDKLKGKLPVSKDTKIISFCGGYHCGLSHKLAKKLLKLGYKNTTVFSGGMPDWKKAGLRTTKSSSKTIVNTTPKKADFQHGLKMSIDEGAVDGDWFKANLSKLPSNVLLVDVRPNDDFKVSHIKGAINIYADDMKAKELFDKLPSNKVIIFTCSTGARAIGAWSKLQDAKLTSKVNYYFDANIECDKNGKCKIEPNEPLG